MLIDSMELDSRRGEGIARATSSGGLIPTVVEPSYRKIMIVDSSIKSGNNEP